MIRLRTAWIVTIWAFLFIVTTLLYLFREPSPVPRGDADAFIRYLDQSIPRLMARHKVPAVAVAFLYEGRICFQKGYGSMKPEENRPVTSRTVFQAASISKAVTAWGVMHLAEQGRLNPDAPVSRYLSRWTLPESEFNQEQVTVRRLLSHSAGIAHVGGYRGFDNREAMQTLEASLSGAADARGEGVGVVYKPGSRYRYSGGGFTLLQLVVDEVTGLPFAVFMRDSVLIPLGMVHSRFVRTPEIEENLCTVYGRDGQPNQARFFTAQAAAGLYTTLEDLTRWALAMMAADSLEAGRGILKPATLASMFRPQAEPKSRLPYGLGYMVQSVDGGRLMEVSHTGYNRPGWASLVSTVPSTGGGLVLLANSPGGLTLRSDLRRAWFFWETGATTYAMKLDKGVRWGMTLGPVWLAGFVLIGLLHWIKRRRQNRA